MDFNDNTKISELTVGELRDLMRAVMTENVQQRHTVQGLQGLADLLGCSTSTVKRYYAILRPAIAKRGRTIVADADRVLSLWSGRRNF